MSDVAKAIIMGREKIKSRFYVCVLKDWIMMLILKVLLKIPQRQNLILCLFLFIFTIYISHSLSHN